MANFNTITWIITDSKGTFHHEFEITTHKFTNNYNVAYDFMREYEADQNMSPDTLELMDEEEYNETFGS